VRLPEKKLQMLKALCAKCLYVMQTRDESANGGF